jgi:hypothetical protein
MRCNICDSVLEKPIWNAQLKGWEPCTTCLDVIFSVFEDYPAPAEEQEEKELDSSPEDAYNILKGSER